MLAEHMDIGAGHIVTVGDIWENNFKGWRGTSYPITSGLGTTDILSLALLACITIQLIAIYLSYRKLGVQSRGHL